jgi:hypothetical protein
MATVTGKWHDPDSDLEFVFDDEGAAAYGYLMRDGRVCSLVWLYNRSPAGDEAPAAPRNPVGLGLPPRLSPAASLTDLSVQWEPQGQDATVIVYLRGFLLGVLDSRNKVGYATMAGEAARVALPLARSGRFLFHVSWTNERNGDVLTVRDDGRVAYAYYLRAGEMRGHVWLYNRVAAPEELPWERPDAEANWPLVNAAGFADEDPDDPPVEASEFDARFLLREEVWTGAIYVRGKLRAITGEDHTPGWSVLARHDSPLALKI